MNRIYKFRGKSKVEEHSEVYIPQVEKGQWVYGGIEYDTTPIEIDGEEEFRVWIDIPYYGGIYVDSDTVGQFTEHYDKNGKEIYDNDIVKYCGELYRVYYDKYYGWCINEEELLGEVNFSEIEVVGNCFDNKNLVGE